VLPISRYYPLEDLDLTEITLGVTVHRVGTSNHNMGTKIIIKARINRGGAASTRTSTPSRSTLPIALPDPDPEEDVVESEDEEGEISESQLDQSQLGDDGERSAGDGLSEVASGEANDIDDGEDAEEGAEEGGPMASRGKGKQRGRGRGLGMGMGSGTGTSTPRGMRGRPRGTGRPRGRGRSSKLGPLTIRLPGRPDEEGHGDKETPDGGKAAAPVEVEEKEEKEAPMGGGKPFRRIQGKVYVIENDEFTTEDDPKGDTKIDIHGNLLGGEVDHVLSCDCPISLNCSPRPAVQSIYFHASKSTSPAPVHACH
jgi:chromatin structure-remodeling complex protein RSC7